MYMLTIICWWRGTLNSHHYIVHLQARAYQVWNCTESEKLGILHGLKKFHHYHFMREACVNTDHKPLVAILSKHVAVPSQQLQCILL